MLTGVDARVYALAPTGDDFSYRLGGHADLRNGRLAVSALAHDVRDLQASFVITDDAFSTTALTRRWAGFRCAAAARSTICSARRRCGSASPPTPTCT
jgi:hypothetical protein